LGGLQRPRGRRGRAPAALRDGAATATLGSRLSRVPWDPLNDEQRELRDLVRSLARDRIAPRAAEIDESHEFPWDVVELFREHGLFGLLFEEEWGGTGTGALLALLAIEEISKVCATSGLVGGAPGHRARGR
jgi:alkylation response protein AidB-like acyl-CoA dehydrogenase